MICPKCGNESSTRFCPNCGIDLSQVMQGQGTFQQINNNGFGYDQTVNGQYGQPQQYGQQVQYGQPRQHYGQSPQYGTVQQKKKASGLSIGAFVLSFLGYLSVAGIVMGIIDLIKSRTESQAKKHGFSIAAIVIGLLVLVSMISKGTGKNTSTDTVADAATSETAAVDSGDPASAKTKSEAENKDENTANIKVVESSRDMKIGDIGKKGDIYVGLSYVKRMSYLPTAYSDEEEIGDGNEVILAFFDFYNNSDKTNAVNPDSITCYVDGVQVEDVDSTWKVKCDGISQYYSEEIADHTQLISVEDFAVPKGWTELKFFYKSDCVWIVDQEDVKEDDYKFSSMYTDLDIKRETVPEGTTIFNDGYEVIYQGIDEYTYSNMFTGDTQYIIFKFTVNNSGSSAIDYSLAGHEMTAYQNNYFMGDASYTLDEKIDGYSNIFNIDSIESGMTANIYVAFECSGTDGNLYMIYDDGYISNKVRGTVYVER